MDMAVDVHDAARCRRRNVGLRLVEIAPNGMQLYADKGTQHTLARLLR